MNLHTESFELFGYTQSLRRDLHQHPELGFHEIRTAGIIVKELTSFGLDARTGVAETGVVAVLTGDHPGPVVLLRADMDALPIVEETQSTYASTIHGSMHACGHDAHTAILLTVAKILTSNKEKLHGSVKFIFQPAEEGMGGAERMIQEGILEDPKPDIALAVHVWNELPVGMVCIGSGPVMAGAEIFKILVTGRGGHGAIPQLALDPILASAHIVTAIQSIVSRNVPPLKTAVVSICTIHGGDTFNVIPSTVEMTGTIRTFDQEVRQIVLDRFEKTVISAAEAIGCGAVIDLHPLTPATINNPSVATRLQSIIKDNFPAIDLITSSYITMGSEDFAFILEKIPGCFIFIGTANHNKGLDAPHHHPKFDIDETALPKAVEILVAATMGFLS